MPQYKLLWSSCELRRSPLTCRLFIISTGLSIILPVSISSIAIYGPNSLALCKNKRSAASPIWAGLPDLHSTIMRFPSTKATTSRSPPSANPLTVTPCRAGTCNQNRNHSPIYHSRVGPMPLTYSYLEPFLQTSPSCKTISCSCINVR